MTKQPYQFVRVLFGDPADPKSKVHRIYREIGAACKAKYQAEPCMVYCFGQDNYNFVVGLGFTAKLLDPRPNVRNDQHGKWKVSWHHKPLAWQAALHDAERIVHLDWGVLIHKPVDAAYIFDGLAKKADLQSCLHLYHRRKLPWRSIDLRKVSSAGFVYIGNKAVADEIERLYSINETFSEETAMAYLIDQRHGGQYCGLETWLANYEPFCCHMPKSGAIPRDRYGDEKDWVFTND